MSLALLFHYLMLNMFRVLIHPSSGACDLFVELFHGLYCSDSMCVGITLWFGCGGVVIRMQTEALVPQPAYGYVPIYVIVSIPVLDCLVPHRYRCSSKNCAFR